MTSRKAPATANSQEGPAARPAWMIGLVSGALLAGAANHDTHTSDAGTKVVVPVRRSWPLAQERHRPRLSGIAGKPRLAYWSVE